MAIVVPRRRVSGLSAPGTIRRFSPDGNLLVCISHDQYSVVLCAVRPGCQDPLQAAFEGHFPIAKSIRIVDRPNDLLCRDFCLFLSDSVMLLASASPSTAGPANRSLGRDSPLCNPGSLRAFEQLDDVCLHAVDLHRGTVTDRLLLSGDYVLLAQQAGVAVSPAGRLAISSIQHQCIVLFRVHRGRFYRDGLVGYYMGFSERLRWTRIDKHGHAAVPETLPSSAACRSGYHGALKQKILRFLYSKAPEGQKSHFHGSSEAISRLLLWKCQFVDEQRLLVKFLPPDAVAIRTPDNSSCPPVHFFFALYNLTTEQVELFEHYSSPVFLDWFLAHDGALRTTASEVPCRDWRSGSIPSFTDSLAMRRQLDRSHLLGVSGCKRLQALRRLLSALPYPSQSLSPTPLLDPEHFRYDERMLGRDGRWRPSPETAIRLVRLRSADGPPGTGERLAVNIPPWSAGHPGESAFKRYHSICWHPDLPLFIVSHQSALRSLSVDLFIM